MGEPGATQYRFGVFEADALTGELRRKGLRVRLNGQSFQVLCLLLARAGELVTREEMARLLWPEGTFVDFEHGTNSAVNRLREALGDTASNPRFVETLARRGYRFVAPVERIGIEAAMASSPTPEPTEAMDRGLERPDSGGRVRPRRWTLLASAEELPTVAHGVVQGLFLALQLMYGSFYVGALANLGEVQELLAAVPHGARLWTVLVATAAMLLPVRAYLVCAVLFRAPLFAERFRVLWWLLLVADEGWALSPFLLLHHLSFGLALACVALLVYVPFVQRSLVLMGAGQPKTRRAEG